MFYKRELRRRILENKERIKIKLTYRNYFILFTSLDQARLKKGLNLPKMLFFLVTVVAAADDPDASLVQTRL